MQDVSEIIKNIDTIYNSNNSLAILKDYERVFDELDIYVFENWEDGEIVQGPIIKRHWVSCSFMWPRNKMPNPEAARRLYEYGCKIQFKKDILIRPRKIKSPDDIRPNSKKGKIDEFPVWVVEIMMPKKLMLEVYRGYHNQLMDELEPANAQTAPQIAEQPAEQQAVTQTAPPTPGESNEIA